MVLTSLKHHVGTQLTLVAAILSPQVGRTELPPVTLPEALGRLENITRGKSFIDAVDARTVLTTPAAMVAEMARSGLQAQEIARLIRRQISAGEVPATAQELALAGAVLFPSESRLFQELLKVRVPPGRIQVLVSPRHRRSEELERSLRDSQNPELPEARRKELADKVDRAPLVRPARGEDNYFSISVALSTKELLARRWSTEAAAVRVSLVYQSRDFTVAPKTFEQEVHLERRGERLEGQCTGSFFDVSSEGRIVVSEKFIVRNSSGDEEVLSRVYLFQVVRNPVHDARFGEFVVLPLGKDEGPPTALDEALRTALVRGWQRTIDGGSAQQPQG